ncbi:MAG: cbb3-type cytochrome c oxidase subunit I [Streptosporangiales bacterium]|nr:cbb3-type cytochrome c oxidase subunit I [Streptosporangiales bacterium]
MTDIQATPTAVTPSRPGGLMGRLNIGTGVLGGLILMGIFWLIAYATLSHGPGDTDSFGSDRVICVTMVGWLLGFMIGIGAFNGPVRWLLGKDLATEEHQFLAGKDQGIGRYFRYTTDHKVVGIQYLVLTMTLFFVGGSLAMMIRTDLITPGSHLFGLQTYNAVVGLHGIIMIIATIIMVTGPFGNFIMPIMIGARDMAFPRLNALSLWLIVPAVPVLLSAAFMGGIPTGWTAYAPLSNEAPPGMDAYLMTIITFAISVALSGMNITVTAITMRARGLSVVRLPIFVWGVVTASLLGLVAFPLFMTAQILEGLDRTAGTVFYVAQNGGSVWLYQNLFWLMGHPEVYVILIPGFCAVLELAPVFARKPLFSYRTAVVGIAGIVGLSGLVWAHHMYITGWAPDLGGPFMLTTEMISVPTGLLILVLVGTIWRGNVWTRLPMMAGYAMIWNFIIGGVTGIYLSDIPVDQALNGSLFVTAHFHYTLMGGAFVGGIAGLSYWFPKMTGRMLNEKWGAIGFWTSQAGFQVTFMSLFAIGLAGEPRRVGDFPLTFAAGNTVATIGAYVIMTGMLIYLGTLVWSWKYGEAAPPNPWGAKTLEWQTPTPVPLENFEVLPVVTSDFYGYGEPEPALDPEPVGVPAQPAMAAAVPVPDTVPESVPADAVTSAPVTSAAVAAGETAVPPQVAATGEQEPGEDPAGAGTAKEEEQ